MSAFETIDHVERGLGQLISLWEGKPIARGLLQAKLEQSQAIEIALAQLNNERGIYEAIGVQLDVIGKLIGESRENREDEDYREALLLRVVLNKADGTPNSVLDALMLLTEATDVDIFEHFPANIHAYTDGQRITNNTVEALDAVAIAGVNVRLMFDNDGDSFVPDDLTLEAGLLIDQSGNIVEGDGAEGVYDIEIQSLTVDSDGEHSYLPDLDDEELINPLCDIL